ncbi:TolC family protein [bacterium]|nr:TolC family protein [bacterium]
MGVRGALALTESATTRHGWWRLTVYACCCSLLTSGCNAVVSDRDPISSSTNIVSDDDAEHYRTRAKQVSQTVAKEDIPMAPALEAGPRTIRQRGNDVPWRLSLIEAVHLAIRNNPVIRQNSQFLSPTSTLMTNPDTNPSVFDIALQHTGVLFGSRGQEAALSDFMPQVSSSLTVGRDLNVQNSLFLGGGLAPGTTLVQDNGAFTSRVDQPLLTGGTFSVFHNWNYLQSNQPQLLFDSAYTGNLGAEFRQPLLAGAGVGYTEIAGPIANRSSVQNGVAQGIRIAQINERIASVDLELNIRNLVLEVGEVYWQLFQAFREHEANAEVRDASYSVWQQLQANEDALGGAVVAQAEQTYLESRSRAENALSGVYETETRLRRLMGIAISDGQLIHPNAIPMSSEMSPDWNQVLGDAYAHRIELHRQKLSIQSLDWQLQAANSLTKPRLDFVGGYQLNGFGDNLVATSTEDGTTDQGYNSAYSALFEAKQPSWNVGVQFSMPLGFRAEQAQVRNLELRLAKARAALSTQEGEIRYELTSTVQTLARWYTLMETNDVRRKAVQRQVDALEAEYRAGRGDRSTIDLLLRARQSLAQAQSEYYRSLASYNISLWDLDYRKGTILANNNLTFDAVIAACD